MLFTLVQIIYWISLATWFGGVLFIAIAAPIIFRTVREQNPILPHVLAVNLEGQHSSLLAGTIVGNLISQLVKVELICAGGLLLALAGQWFITDVSGPGFAQPFLRSTLFVAAVAVVLYVWRSLWPRIEKYRQEYIDHADEPDIANEAKDHFDRLHKESVMLLTARLALLLGMVLFSATIVERRAEFPIPRPQTTSAAPAVLGS